MADITEQLTSMLSDPGQLEKIKQMASSLIGSETPPSVPPPAPPPAAPSVLGDISPEMLGGIMKVLGALKERPNDQNTAFLTALKPLLHTERRERIDSAIKLLRVFSVLPMLKSSGVLDLF